MVRLKEICETLIKRQHQFQFQYGAIEGQQEAAGGGRRQHFNSSMVRLKEKDVCFLVLLSPISIPVWCDWRFKFINIFVSCYSFQFQYGAIEGDGVVGGWYNYKEFQFQYGAIEGETFHLLQCVDSIFQFQYGAIEGILLRWANYCLPYFNSSMVRLKAQSLMLLIPDLHISIPVWCDWRPYPIA